MFFSADDKGAFASMALNWPRNDVQAVVVSDGSRILGLGDLGLNGAGICVGKCDLYVAAAGFDPARVLPVVLDVGTNNERLLKDPLYMGVRRRRLTGSAYYELADELIGALTRRWPKAVIQFEDFSLDVARPLLERYRHHHTTFNDDIQGTAAVALGGLYSALRAQGLPRSALGQQRVVVVGAGSAGMGVVETLARGMERSASPAAAAGLPKGGSAGRFWVLDKDGLITKARRGLPPHVAPYARRPALLATDDDEDEEQAGSATTTTATALDGPDDPAALADAEGEDLLSVVKRVRPTVLLGLAGAGKLFTPEVLRAMAEGVASHGGNARGLAPKPVVFAMSNPTSKLECTAQEAYDYTDGQALYASGSPQPEVVLKSQGGGGGGGMEGPTATRRTSQSNNLYIFGGVALGAHLAKARAVTDNMLMAAAEVLPDLVSEEDARQGLLYPPLSEIRSVSAAVAAAVMRAAAADGLVTDGTVLGALAGSDERLRAWVSRRMWRPASHQSLAYLPPGVGE
jgi:malate dehydrogenase (decarboxylating)